MSLFRPVSCRAWRPHTPREHEDASNSSCPQEHGLSLHWCLHVRPLLYPLAHRWEWPSYLACETAPHRSTHERSVWTAADLFLSRSRFSFGTNASRFAESAHLGHPRRREPRKQVLHVGWVTVLCSLRHHSPSRITDVDAQRDAACSRQIPAVNAEVARFPGRRPTGPIGHQPSVVFHFHADCPGFGRFVSHQQSKKWRMRESKRARFNLRVHAHVKCPYHNFNLDVFWLRWCVSDLALAAEPMVLL